MSSVVFVRHAQASLFGADYDQLSVLGQSQARFLGKYLASLDHGFDEVYIGPRRRHRQTAELVFEQVEGKPPEWVELPQLDEHQVDRLATQHVEKLARVFPEVCKLHVDFRGSTIQLERQRSFARLFESIAGLWLAGRCELYGTESWSDFTTRVNEGIDIMLRRVESGRRVLVFTSAGTIGVALRRALCCPDDVALGLGWRMWNCSLTRFMFSGDRFSLDQFNSMPHMLDQSSWTYR